VRLAAGAVAGRDRARGELHRDIPARPHRPARRARGDNYVVAGEAIPCALPCGRTESAGRPDRSRSPAVRGRIRLLSPAGDPRHRALLRARSRFTVREEHADRRQPDDTDGGSAAARAEGPFGRACAAGTGAAEGEVVAAPSHRGRRRGAFGQRAYVDAAFQGGRSGRRR